MPSTDPDSAFDHQHRVDTGRPQGDAGCGIVAPGPREAGGRAAELGQLGGPLERLVPERRPIVVVERRLVGGREHVAVEHARVRVIEDRRFHPPAEQRIGLAHEVLVECVVRGDEHRDPVTLPSGTAPLLAETGHGAGKPDRDHAVEEADVDAQLERIGCRDTQQLTGREPLLDVPPLRRRVAGPVRREPVLVLAAEPVESEPMDQLRRPACSSRSTASAARAPRARRAGERPPRARSRGG